MFFLVLIGCKKTKDFNYKHPKDPTRLLRVSLSLDSEDMIRLVIDGKQIEKKKIDLKPIGTTGRDIALGYYEEELVTLSCARDYVSIKTTWCDFTIGKGPSVRLDFD